MVVTVKSGGESGGAWVRVWRGWRVVVVTVTGGDSDAW
jgi:hypothetical protein